MGEITKPDKLTFLKYAYLEYLDGLEEIGRVWGIKWDGSMNELHLTLDELIQYSQATNTTAHWCLACEVLLECADDAELKEIQQLNPAKANLSLEDFRKDLIQTNSMFIYISDWVTNRPQMEAQWRKMGKHNDRIARQNARKERKKNK